MAGFRVFVMSIIFLTIIHNHSLIVSRKLSATEKKWTTSEVELKAITWSLEKLREYVWGQTVEVRSDHHILCHLLRQKKVEGSPKLTRMILSLTDYNIEICYTSGKRHLLADCLSRAPVDEPRMENSDEEDESKLPIRRIMADDLPKQQREDPWIGNIIKKLQNKNCPRRIRDKFVIANDILFAKNLGYGNEYLIVVPKKKIPDVLEHHHNHPLAGSHGGVYKTYKKIKTAFYWPRIKQDVYEFVISCRDCMTRKASRQAKAGYMQFIDVPSKPFVHIQIDFMGSFKTSDSGKRYVITAICYLTKYLRAKAVKEDTAKAAAEFLCSEIINNHSVPKIVQSDRGKQFIGQVAQEMSKIIGYEIRPSTANRPCTNGAIERTHSQLYDCIAIYADKNQKNWDKLVPFFCFSINSSVHASHGYSPFYMLYGYHPTMPMLANLQEIAENDNKERIKELQQAREIAKEVIEKGRLKYAERYNAKRRHKEYNIGDLVMFHRRTRKEGTSNKLLHPYFGPYEVIEKLSDVNYKIKALDRDKENTEIAHVEKLRPYYARPEALCKYSSEEDESANSNNKDVHDNDIIPELEEKTENPNVNNGKVDTDAQQYQGQPQEENRAVGESDSQQNNDNPETPRYNLRPRQQRNYRPSKVFRRSTPKNNQK